MYKKSKLAILQIPILSLILAAVLTASVFAEDIKGTFIYGNTADNKCFYERVVKLNNGDLLCTFMRTCPPADWSVPTKSFYFYKSTDGGKTWNYLSELSADNFGFNTGTQGMPGMFVFPRQLGNYPAGTVLFAVSDWDDTATYTIHIWRSTDNGVTWQLHGQLAQRINNQRTWEPEFAVSSDGRLVCYYSDERQRPLYDQCIAREISNDGGVTWGNFSIIVGKSGTAWRPGMPRVMKLKNGNYFMAYENFAYDSSFSPAGAVSYRISNDGINWGAADILGALVKTTDDQYAIQAPEIAFMDDGSTYGRIFVRGMNDTCLTNKLFTSKDNGATWSVIDAPLTASRKESVGAGWSGTLLPISNTVLLELNNYYNGSFNEIRCGLGMLNTDALIISGAIYQLTNKNSNLCLDDPGGSMVPGTQLIQWNDNDLATQRWRVEYTGNNYFKLTCMYSNLVLDNQNGSSADGNPIIQWSNNDLDPQRWSLTYMGNGYYKIVNKASNKPMDVSGESALPGALIVQNSDSGTDSQRWKIEQENIVRLRSKNIADNFIRHQDYRGKISHNDTFRTAPFQDSEWKKVKGLADPSCVSFESVNMPGYYLRHRNGEVWADPYSDTPLFKNDATWRVRPGLADNAMLSFEAYNIANNYLRHADGLLWITYITTELDRQDATFKEIK